MEEYTLKEFLEKVPPGNHLKIVSDFVRHEEKTNYVASPDINLYCETDTCQGTRTFFAQSKEAWLSFSEENNKYLTYTCRNCRASAKIFAIGAVHRNGKWHAVKYAEMPSFGPPTPARAVTLIGGEKNLFFMGRRCENQGMGIAAFVYYRRVIESQRDRIFDELIRVVNVISPGDDVLKDLERAKSETRFTKAVETIKHALPQSLLINGFNPLTLLHTALSKGVHEHNDEECLELATSARTVLI